MKLLRSKGLSPPHPVRSLMFSGPRVNEAHKLTSSVRKLDQQSLLQGIALSPEQNYLPRQAAFSHRDQARQASYRACSGHVEPEHGKVVV